jgi:hypothetical protein
MTTHTNPSVVIGYLTPGTVTGEFCRSLTNSVAWMMSQRFQLAVRVSFSGPRVYAARNDMFREELLRDGWDWFFMVDSDMAWEPDAIARLVAAADAEERPIVAALTFGRAGAGWFPTMYLAEPEKQSLMRLEEWPADALVPVDATGSSCMLIHRSVIEAMLNEYGATTAAPWYQEVEHNGTMMGSDLVFCLRARQMGFPIYVHTGVEFGHQKPVMVDTDYFQRWRQSHRFVITGTGRCGTKYLAQALGAAGVSVGHEVGYTPGQHEWGPFRGESSWLAVPWLEELSAAGVYVLHVVRHPVDVINSLVTFGAFSGRDVSNPYRQFVLKHYPILGEDLAGGDFELACRFWVEWNRRIERYANARVRIEDVTGADLVPMLRHGDAMLSAATMDQYLAATPSDVNHRGDTATYEWDDLPGDVRELAAAYGYTESGIDASMMQQDQERPPDASD